MTVAIEYKDGSQSYQEIIHFQENKGKLRITTTEGEYEVLNPNNIKKVRLFDFGILRERWVVTEKEKFKKGV
jgi:hypothetical protein